MGIRGLSYNFSKVKQILISQLSEGDSKQKMLAYTLAQFSWSTHMGRGFFSNLITNNTQNPYLISVARGDSDFSSALPYIAESEQSMEDISTLLEQMYKNLQKDNI
ncbi:MAG: hypothetical protein J6A03_13845 [Lachnospiraceae bacterium]|nr:hypothetical protein [Lachnospiraceae bacterium]